jgi:hypothetical protein
VGLNADDEVWDATTSTKNRDRLLEADVAQPSAHAEPGPGSSGGVTQGRRVSDGTELEAAATKTPGNRTVRHHQRWETQRKTRG